VLVPIEQGLPVEPGRVRQLLLARAVRSPEPIGSSRGRAAPIGGYATRVPALVRHAR